MWVVEPTDKRKAHGARQHICPDILCIAIARLPDFARVAARSRYGAADVFFVTAHSAQTQKHEKGHVA